MQKRISKELLVTLLKSHFETTGIKLLDVTVKDNVVIANCSKEQEVKITDNLLSRLLGSKFIFGKDIVLVEKVVRKIVSELSNEDRHVLLVCTGAINSLPKNLKEASVLLEQKGIHLLSGTLSEGGTLAARLRDIGTVLRKKFQKEYISSLSKMKQSKINGLTPKDFRFYSYSTQGEIESDSAYARYLWNKWTMYKNRCVAGYDKHRTPDKLN